MARGRINPRKGKTLAAYRTECGFSANHRMSPRYPSDRPDGDYHQRPIDDIRRDLAEQLEEILRRWDERLAS